MEKGEQLELTTAAVIGLIQRIERLEKSIPQLKNEIKHEEKGNSHYVDLDKIEQQINEMFDYVSRNIKGDDKNYLYSSIGNIYKIMGKISP